MTWKQTNVPTTYIVSASPACVKKHKHARAVVELNNHSVEFIHFFVRWIVSPFSPG